MKVLLIVLAILSISTLSRASWPTSELDCLAANVYFEARGEPIRGQYMVAYVTINRAKDGKFPNTICGVVKQESQFSWVNDHIINKPTDMEQWKKAKQIARSALNKSYSVIKMISKGALFYHADYVKPRWRKGLVYVTQIDSHIFYK